MFKIITIYRNGKIVVSRKIFATAAEAHDYASAHIPHLSTNHIDIYEKKNGALFLFQEHHIGFFC